MRGALRRGVEAREGAGGYEGRREMARGGGGRGEARSRLDLTRKMHNQSHFYVILREELRRARGGGRGDARRRRGG